MLHRWILAVFAAFFLTWLSSYFLQYPLTNFLWTCNIALTMTAVSVFVTRDSLGLSMALCLVVVPDVLWILDVLVRAITGTHLTGGTEYVFDASIPWLVRCVSFEHALLVPFLVYMLRRRGYDSRALIAVGILLPTVYYVTYYVSDPLLHTNWVWGLFASRQQWLPALIYPAIAATTFLLVFATPVHFAARRWLPHKSYPSRQR